MRSENQSSGRIIRVCRSGNLVAIDDPSDEVRRLLEPALFYDRIVTTKDERGCIRGREPLPIECYQYVVDPDGKFPTRLVAAAGFLRRIATVLKDGGYRVMVRDLTPPAPEVFTPYWGRLAKVRWKWRQKEIIQRLLRVDYGQVRVPPGFGKTYLLVMLADLLPKARFAITTASLDVIEMIHWELSRRIPDVGLICGSSRRRGRRVNCYSLDSLQHCEDPVDVLIVDELHEAGTDNRLRKLTQPAFRFAKHWGFSASAGDRTDKADFELEGVFGPILIDLPYADCVQHNCVVPIEVQWRNVVMDVDPVGNLQNHVAKQRRGIWRNSYRNELIASDARSFPDDDQVLITVSSIEHGLFLRRLLPEFKLCYSENAFSSEEGIEKQERYVNWGLMRENEEMTYERRENLRKAFESGRLKKAIATSVWNRGVNFRPLAVLIRADAVGSAIADTQIPGRTSRLCDETGKRVSVVIDYKDQFNKGFRDKAYVRRSHYKQHGWRQIDPARAARSSQLQRALF